MTDSGRTRLLEALSVLTIIGCVSAVAVPKYDDLKRRDVASQVLGDVDVLRNAVYAFYSDSAYFPAESPSGELPEGLAYYLPVRFKVTRDYGAIVYKNWPVDSTHREATAAPNVVGATVTTRDPRIGATAAALSPAAPQFTVGDRFTFLFFGT